jgi:hypothetical protein
MYPIKRFGSEARYREFANRTYFAGREMLTDCGVKPKGASGIIAVKDAGRIEDLHRKAGLLSLSQDEFRQMEPDEATSIIGELAEKDASYFIIPDSPFDEAGVMTSLRAQALTHGTEFIEVSAPVKIERRRSGVRILFEGEALDVPATLVAAGSGSFELMKQAGYELNGVLRRTPLLVSGEQAGLPSPVYVDLERGFSAVSHQCEGMCHGVVVVGTRATFEPAPRIVPDDRIIPACECKDFEACLPPALAAKLYPGRYTAGYEVIPSTETGKTIYEPWIEDMGDIVFASPGRATVALEAARETLARLIPKMTSGAAKTQLPLRRFSAWSNPITMHFTPTYSFDDAEKQNV